MGRYPTFFFLVCLGRRVFKQLTPAEFLAFLFTSPFVDRITIKKIPPRYRGILRVSCGHPWHNFGDHVGPRQSDNLSEQY